MMRRPMTPPRAHALTNILCLLGLETLTSLPQRNKDILMDRLYDLPSDDRTAVEVLAFRLELAEMVLATFCRGEVAATLKKSPELQERLHAVAARATKLAQS